MSTTAFIAAAVRSAIGKKKGAFATTRADDLLADISDALERAHAVVRESRREVAT